MISTYSWFGWGRDDDVSGLLQKQHYVFGYDEFTIIMGGVGGGVGESW